MKTDQAVAIVGASNDRAKFGNKAVRAFVEQGFNVLPVNPKEKEIEGLACFPDIETIPQPVDVVNFYLPPQRIPALLPQAKAKGATTIWLNPGTESDEIFEKASELGLTVKTGCSILAIGVNPSSL